MSTNYDTAGIYGGLCMKYDSIVEEIHRARREIYRQFKGDMAKYHQYLAKKEFPGFKVVHLKPAVPFAI